MRINSYTEYMRHIARQYAPISKIFEIDVLDLKEFESVLRASIPSPLVFLLESYSRQSLKTNVENHHDIISASFLILDKIEGKQIVKLADLHRAEEAAMQIRYRMELDYAMQCNVLDGLQLDSFSLESCGIFGYEWTGFRFVYVFSVEEKPILAATDWPNYTPFKSLR